MIFSEPNAKIAAAFTKAWGQISNPTHNASVTVKLNGGGSYKFDYTDLGGIFNEAKSVFKENDISILQNAYTEVVEGKKVVSVETLLLHSSGEYVKSLPLRMDASTKIQDMGGQVTYMKRYSLSAMLGISTEKDDDANGASGNEYTHSSKGNASNNPSNGSTKATAKAKWEKLSGNDTGFEDFYKDQKTKGFNDNQINAFLQTKIDKKAQK